MWDTKSPDWVVNPPNWTGGGILYNELTSMSLAASCINIALQRGTEDLESWCDKWL